MIAPLLLLGGCKAVLLSPSGDVALRERDLIIASTLLMLLIILPVMIATLIFAWRYRATNTTAAYDPDWHHSTQLEMLIWTAPLLIIVALGAITWSGTHLLDPFRPLHRLGTGKPLAAGVKPLRIDVVALDWKWLFFYPAQGIATVNDLYLPTDVPIDFHLTSATVMNSFFIPALAGQIYTMAGMETRLSLVVNEPGDFNGLSSQYSGAGFSHMNFGTHGVSQADFDKWVAKSKDNKATLDAKTYAQLEKPSEQVPATVYGSFTPGLFEKILNLCPHPGQMCQTEMMHIDATGGGGRDSEANRKRLLYSGTDARGGSEAPAATFPASGRPPNSDVQPQGMKEREAAPQVNQQKTQPGPGQGQKMPGAPDTSPAPAQLHQH